MDILARSSLANQIRSPFLRLPEKVVAIILESLDLDTILRLRHTCRIFMVLFSTKKSFQRHHLTPEQDKERHTKTALIWAVPEVFFPKQAANWFGPLCAHCSRKRKNDVFGKELLLKLPSLYCSRCRKDHTEMHFSTWQRDVRDPNERICIGHEGYFNLCDHVTMTWHQVRSLEHATNDKLAVCRRHLHDSTPSCGDAMCPWDEVHAIPYFTLERRTNKMFLQLSYSEHITVKRAPSSKMCAESLRVALEKMNDHMELAKWMPCARPVAGNILRAIDPNMCDCVDWHGTDSRRISWQLCPDPAKVLREPPHEDSYTSSRARCNGFKHGFRTEYTGAQLAVTVIACRGRDDFLVISQRATYDISEACGPGWGFLVSGQSFYKREDKDTHGVTWCDVSECGVSRLLKNNMHMKNIEARIKAKQHN